MAEELRPLIAAARGGDRQALSSLASCVDRFVRIHSGALSAHLRRTRGSTVDFVLEGLAEALARISHFEYRSDEQFYAWVSRYIRNRIVDAAREEQAVRRAGRPLPLKEILDDPPARQQSPSTALFREELRAAIGDAVVELHVKHPQEMEAVVLKLFEDQTWPELRERFGLTSDKKARSLFAKGIDLLRPLVKKSLGESGVREFLGQGGST